VNAPRELIFRGVNHPSIGGGCELPPDASYRQLANPLALSLVLLGYRRANSL